MPGSAASSSSATTAAGTIPHSRAAARRSPIPTSATSILPMLRDRGVDEATLTMLTHDNPFNAYAR